MNVSRFPVTPRECCACRSPLKPGERDVCRPCSMNDLYPAAREYLRANPKRRRRWPR